MKTTLITGCSSGFGMLTAIRLASSGYSVFATMRNLEKKENLLKEINNSGLQIELIELDVTRNETIIEALDTIKSKTGRLDYLINNAGYGLGGFFEDISEYELRRQARAVIIRIFVGAVSLQIYYSLQIYCRCSKFTN